VKLGLCRRDTRANGVRMRKHDLAGASEADRLRAAGAVDEPLADDALQGGIFASDRSNSSASCRALERTRSRAHGTSPRTIRSGRRANRRLNAAGIRILRALEPKEVRMSAHLADRRQSGRPGYGKHRYQEEQKAKQARKSQADAATKEVRLRPKTSSHDYAWKRARLAEFLGDGHKVKVVVLLRGRERERPERGRDLLLRVAADLSGLGRAESIPLNEGRSMSLVISPLASAAGRAEQ
jgi:translation initiation factor IF-3